MQTNSEGRKSPSIPQPPSLGESSPIPEGYLLLSDAVHRLRLGMFAGLPRPVPVRQAKATYFDGSVGLGSWTEEAAKCIAVAAKNGELPVHVFGNPYAYNKGVGELETMIVPTEVLRRIVPSRGGFPDHPRVPLRAVRMDRRLFVSLNTGVLVVGEYAFSSWYRKEKAKGKWASQPSKLKKLGRPSKQTESLDKEIIEILAEKKISAAALHRRLVKDGRSPISVDTIERRVKRLYLKTGDKRYRLSARRKPRWALRFPQNPFRNSGK